MSCHCALFKLGGTHALGLHPHATLPPNSKPPPPHPPTHPPPFALCSNPKCVVASAGMQADMETLHKVLHSRHVTYQFNHRR